DDHIVGVVMGEETGEDTDERDFLNGGEGDDLFVLGNSDYGTGGAGEDTFALGEWFAEGSAATITDFNSEEYTLVVHYSEDDEIPEVSVETEDGNSMVL
ncbi:calcium-binding protein, partial [Falsihalocynthiibacter sp. S25ZX9]